MDTALWEEQYSMRGTICFSNIAGIWAVYNVNGTEVFLSPDGRAMHEPANKPVVLTDQDLIRQAIAMAESDRKIEAARDRAASKLAKGTALLQTVIRWHMEYTGGKVSDPYVVDDVEFFQVGRNSSHSFYIGTSDGKRFVLACGEDGWDEELDQPTFSESVREVESWRQCYLGHF